MQSSRSLGTQTKNRCLSEDGGGLGRPTSNNCNHHGPWYSTNQVTIAGQSGRWLARLGGSLS